MRKTIFGHQEYLEGWTADAESGKTSEQLENKVSKDEKAEKSRIFKLLL